jgi:hypothetical protein
LRNLFAADPEVLFSVSAPMSWTQRVVSDGDEPLNAMLVPIQMRRAECGINLPRAIRLAGNRKGSGYKQERTSATSATLPQRHTD